jgi:DNA-binding SARP family transcriptional activator
MDFRILGPLEVRENDRLVDLGPLKQRSLLALLLLQPNRVVSTDWILEELWGDNAAGKENALWVYVSRLRSALEPTRDERGRSTVLLTRDHGYLVSVEPDAIDAHRFERQVAEGRSLLRTDPAEASRVLAEALALWRGGALQDFADEEFARAEIARLEDLRWTAIEDRLEADLRTGAAGELVGELEALTRAEPFRERPVGQLMTALYRAGRQAEALRAFERYRRTVGEELGIEPSPELRRLQEQILLHDARLQPPPMHDAATSPGQRPLTNPFKGLYPFGEADADDFFGRERLVADLVSRLASGARLIALVGPSGSGKSSVVRGGVLPALRRGAAPGSEHWLLATMVPSAFPLIELEAALLRASPEPPSGLADQLQQDDAGLLRAAVRLLPDEGGRLLVVIDQFEELFAFVDDPEEIERFIRNLETAVDDPHGRIRVLLTMRADAYDRPLAYASFGARLGEAIVNVVPLTPDELEAAAEEPVARLGVSLEPALLAELLSDVVGQPGALPIFQYTLRELFDRRTGDVLTVESYRSMGGVHGALSRRADELYDRLDPEQRAAAKQLFLRLVTITDHDQWTRRRVQGAEIVALDVDVVAMEAVIGAFGQQRFLAFDRDPVTGAPTVEVAHEALLREWDRLRQWIQDGRDDVRRHASLRAALDEWVRAEREPDYLLSGTRLAEYEQWSETTPLRLTTTEQDNLSAGRARRQEALTNEDRLWPRSGGSGAGPAGGSGHSSRS